MAGTVDEAAAADIVTVRVKMGGVLMATIVSPGTGVTAKGWHISGNATLRGVGGAAVMPWHIDMSVATNSSDAHGVGSVNTGIVQNVTVTVQWNNAKAGNIFTCDQGFMEYKH